MTRNETHAHLELAQRAGHSDHRIKRFNCYHQASKACATFNALGLAAVMHTLRPGREWQVTIVGE